MEIWSELTIPTEKQSAFNEMIGRYDKNIFAPQSPISWKDNITEWLSNYDILNVMSQYENKYPKFYHCEL